MDKKNSSIPKNVLEKFSTLIFYKKLRVKYKCDREVIFDQALSNVIKLDKNRQNKIRFP